ncbi:putative serine/threonine protein kinase [Streptomyces bingchenggensis BCW-1]|uniref:Putative serine/threonine protein kinase n=1 Tax=Streptomyces bingchenggensis (strain BCW-1) TaxID=749414 RepID=D7CCI8_STRBB|nr:MULTISPECIES: serine/threonine-protein kinase [Streptomyces]ADI08719.1 putative serine/threonine protein kinase [Streptomyces bingchenggensis BCW-1]
MSLSTGDPDFIGGYTLVDRLGAGGMGVVYLGRSASGRHVAVKLVHQQYAQDEEFRTRFRQEVAAARKVSGAFTAPVVDADPDAERPWMATLYVPGPTLSEVVRKQGPLDGRSLRTLGLGLVEALRDIHQVGVVHRDLKPSNILMADDGPRVIDFGISRAADNQTLTVTIGRVLGTPPFMSPEQLRSPRGVTAASDVFSLGSLLVFAATGAAPFESDSPYVSGYQVMYEQPTLAGVPGPLTAIAERCLAKEPTERPDLAELHRMLDALPDFAAAAPSTAEGPHAQGPHAQPHAQGPTHLGTSAPKAPEALPAPPPGEPAAGRRRRRLILTVVGATLALAGLTVAAVMFATDSPSPGADADSSSVRAAALPEGWRPWQASLRDTTPGPPLVYQQSGCVSDATTLYCGGTGFSVAAVDAATGHVRWRYGDSPQQARPIGVRDGVLYVYQESEGNGRRVVALDADTKKQRWQQEISGSGSAALFSGGVLTLSDGEREFIAYGTSGELLWRSPARAGAFCDPTVLGGVPYALCSSIDKNGLATEGPYTLLRLDPADGTQRELATLPKKSLLLGAFHGQPLFLAPQTAKEVYDEGYVRPYNALIRVDPRTGGTKRIALSHTMYGKATLLNGVVYFIETNGTISAVSADTGRRSWRRATDLESLSAPVESKKYGRLYFCNRFGRLLALNTRTGEEAWRITALNDVGIGAVAVPPSVMLIKDAIVATAGYTAFSVRPDRPSAWPSGQDSDKPSTQPSASGQVTSPGATG